MSVIDWESPSAPTTVTATDWGVAYQTTSGKPGVMLRVIHVGHSSVVYHPIHHGLWFPTKGEAKKYALDKGLLQVWEAGTPWWRGLSA